MKFGVIIAAVVMATASAGVYDVEKSILEQKNKGFEHRIGTAG